VEPPIYVTGHKNPDTDSIASSIGLAELRTRLDVANRYVPVRLGEVNAQTRWLLDRSGAPEPEFLSHIRLRVCDVMTSDFPVADEDEPVREAGLTMAREDVDLVPVVSSAGALVGVISERGLARRYIRESRETSSLVDSPTAISAIVGVLEGRLVAGDEHGQVAGRVWVHSMDPQSRTGIAPGDVVVVGDRPEAQHLAIELGADLVVISNGAEPSEEALAFARERGTAVICSPLDSYVTGRMITLAAPCRSVMDSDPLTVHLGDLVADVAETVKDIHYHAAVAVDGQRPVGLVTRSDLVSPRPRRVILVDHAELAQSVPGVDEAEIVEILDHHHIGSVETTVPVRATFDPVGSTATLIVERFRQSGMEPSPSTATMLLGAVLSDTVILNSPTTTERDRAVVEYFERVLRLDATEFGREMFEQTSDVSKVPAEDIVTRDAKEYEVGAGTLCIAQIETVGRAVLERQEELLEAMEAVRVRSGYLCYALMLTDILAKGTVLLVTGERAPAERAFGDTEIDGIVDLPGVMSRKKQLAPRLLAAF
jgi:manganese-dependent inorganic pyrophosphatase